MPRHSFYSTSTDKILISSNGLSNLSVFTFSIRVQISIPFTTRPKTVCLLSSQGVGTVVMKTANESKDSMRKLGAWYCSIFLFANKLTLGTVCIWS